MCFLGLVCVDVFSLSVLIVLMRFVLIGFELVRFLLMPFDLIRSGRFALICVASL